MVVTGNLNSVLANKIISCYLPVLPGSLFMSRFGRSLNPIKDDLKTFPVSNVCLSGAS